MDQEMSGSNAPNNNGSDSPTKDKLFDPSIDMLINDFDDERTLEEEEALAAGEASDPSAELSSLEKEGNMPLEELLALYGYSTNKENESSSESELEEEENAQEEEICEPIVEKERTPTPPKQSKLTLLYESMAEDNDSRTLRSVSRLSEDEDEDFESGGEDDDYRKIRKTIMVGGDYQAQIPEGLSHYDNVPPYENDDKLLWNPQEVYTENVEDYLRKAHEINKPPIPKGTVLRDDEEALYLLQQCGYNADEALRRLRMRPPGSPVINNTNNDVIWSEEECRNFESGVRSYGKNFYLIQQNKVKTRSVGELVQFYYLWKKTERHDIFANKVRLEKKKYNLHPGLTDFMDRFLEDQDRDCSLSPNSVSGPANLNGKPPDT